MGHLYLLNRARKVVSIIDSTGQMIGPLHTGPLMDPIGVTIDTSGTVVIADERAGTYIRVLNGQPISAMRRLGRGYAVPWRGGFDHRNRLYEVFPGANDHESPALILYDSSGRPEASASLPILPAHNTFVHVTDGSTTVAAIPFSGQLLWEFDGMQTIWSANSSEYEIASQRFNGDTIEVVKRAYMPFQVGADASDSARRQLEWFEKLGGQVDARMIPRLRPALRALAVDDSGYVWVMPQTNPVQALTEFDIFGHDGHLRATALLTVQSLDTPRPRIIHGFLYMAFIDSTGTTYFGRFAINRHDM